MRAPTPAQLRMRALHERIEANFDDREAWLVYADALQEKGDVRGELITSWHLGREFDAAVARHAQSVFGPAAPDVAPDGPFSVSFRHGTVYGVTARFPTAEGSRKRAHDLVDRLRKLLAQPVCQWLRRYSIEFPDGAGFTQGLVDPSVSHLRYPEKLRELEIAAFKGDERSPYPLEATLSVELLRLDSLERLSLYGRFTTTRFTMHSFSHRRLAYLALTSDNFFEPDFDALARCSLPALTTLDLMLYSKHSFCAANVLRKFTASDGLPALRELKLRSCMFADDILAALEGSPMLARLHTLDLGNSDYDAARLAQPAFAHLAVTEYGKPVT